MRILVLFLSNLCAPNIKSLCSDYLYLLLSNPDLMIRGKEICTKEVKRFDKTMTQIWNKKGWFCLNLSRTWKIKICCIIYIKIPIIWDQLAFNVDMNKCSQYSSHIGFCQWLLRSIFTKFHFGPLCSTYIEFLTLCSFYIDYQDLTTIAP